MQLWLNTAIDLVTDSPSEISTACRVSRDRWYEWKTNILNNN